MAGIRIEEKLEQLLTPTSRSISFQLTFGSNAKKQKAVVLKSLTTFVTTFHIFCLKSLLTSIFRYNLLDFTNEKSKKEYNIEIPDKKFAQWLSQYRASVVKRDSEEDDNEGWNRA